MNNKYVIIELYSGILFIKQFKEKIVFLFELKLLHMQKTIIFDGLFFSS